MAEFALGRPCNPQQRFTVRVRAGHIERILCGAKEGDHFTLEGEMLHLPPGQGWFSDQPTPVALVTSFCRHFDILSRSRPLIECSSVSLNFDLQLRSFLY
ncbi:hypothetical protein C8R46DRAFT_52271 [Mycena filopes]|nr:hypothetical protein C8R46DRAFT_52271 [Mycena filopes]